MELLVDLLHVIISRWWLTHLHDVEFIIRWCDGIAGTPTRLIMATTVRLRPIKIIYWSRRNNFCFHLHVVESRKLMSFPFSKIYFYGNMSALRRRLMINIEARIASSSLFIASSASAFGFQPYNRISQLSTFTWCSAQSDDEARIIKAPTIHWSLAFQHFEIGPSPESNNKITITYYCTCGRDLFL